MNFAHYFYYENGVLYWKNPISTRLKRGDVAGTIINGYVCVNLNKKRHLAHRIIWELHNGKIPDGYEIDHINHIRNDNRIENLRLVTRKENGRNIPLHRNNKSGVSGVCWNKKYSRWYAQIKVNGKMLFLGSFIGIDEAIKARKEAEVKYGFHENHGDKNGYSR